MQRKAYIFSGSSLLLLIGLMVLTLLNVSPFSETISFVFHLILVGAVILPPLVMNGKAEKQNEEVFSSFADITEPGNPSFEFDVPSLEKYRKIKSAPIRLAVTLSFYLLLIFIAAGTAISEMVNHNVPFWLVEGAAIASALLTFSLIAMYIVATARELKYRKRFETEIIEGLRINGYKPVISFNPEDTSDRKVLMRNGNDHYWWWSLQFVEGKAVVNWEDSKADSPKTGTVPIIGLNHQTITSPTNSPVLLSGDPENAT